MQLRAEENEDAEVIFRTVYHYVRKGAFHYGRHLYRSATILESVGNKGFVFVHQASQ